MITNEPYLEERRLFGRAVAINPEELALRHQHTRAKSLGHQVLADIVGIKDSRDTEEEHARRLFMAAVRDTYNFYECVLRPDFSQDDRISIAKHPKTVKRLIEFAMHKDEDILNASGGNPYSQNNYILSEDARYITVAHLSFYKTDEGCPFAGNNKLERADPLFMKFADWGSRLVFGHHEAYTAGQQDSADIVSALA